MRTIVWNNTTEQLEMIDQRLLPAKFEVVSLTTVNQVAAAIKDMVVRGAPAIGVAAAYGMALAARASTSIDKLALNQAMSEAAERLMAARPTAVNLAWAVKQMLTLALDAASPMQAAHDLLLRAHQMADEDVQTNRRMAEFGAVVIHEGDTIIHHCNTGALATVDYGTALGVIRMAHEQGKSPRVLVDETRPRLQGARLTAWELEQLGIPYEIISDNMSGYLLRKGEAQLVLFGADRVAANGDVVNKIGSYMLALAAHHNHVPVYAVFPFSTLDLTLANGDLVPIEERDPAEVLGIQIDGQAVVPASAAARNPAFDVTPADLLTGWITDRGIISHPFDENIRSLI